MERLLWLSADGDDPEETFDPIAALRPAPIPLSFTDATPAALDRYLPDVIFVDGRGRPEECAVMARKLRPDTGAPIVAVVDPADLTGFDPRAVDDFIVTPSQEAEVRLRIMRAVSPEPEPADVLRRGEITINRERFEVRVRGDVIDLTFKEFELLAYLAERPGKVCSRNTLLSEVWGYDFFGGTRTVDVHIRRLRAKLGHEADMIETVRNVGYRFSG